MSKKRMDEAVDREATNSVDCAQPGSVSNGGEIQSESHVSRIADGRYFGRRILQKAAYVSSAIYILGALAVAILSDPPIWRIQLNEAGDYWAGVLGPVALIWLVLGYLQQGEELEQNTVALMLQVEELKASVNQQKDSVDQQRMLVETSRAQIEMAQAATAEARRVRRITSQPIFVPCELFASKRPDFDNKMYVAVSLRNVGKEITRVEPAFTGENAETHTAMIPKWATSEDIPIEGFFPEDFEGAVGLSLKFLDASFEPSQVTFVGKLGRTIYGHSLTLEQRADEFEN